MLVQSKGQYTCGLSPKKRYNLEKSKITDGEMTLQKCMLTITKRSQQGKEAGGHKLDNQIKLKPVCVQCVHPPLYSTITKL